MKRIVSTVFLVFLCFNILAQKFCKRFSTIISPDLISIEQYSALQMENNNTEMKFNKQSPYTYILLINDNQHQQYQLLYQTDIWENLSYVALSNNLFSVFECNNDNWLSFWKCSKTAASSVLRSVATDQKLSCIVERLNDCVEKSF